MSTLCARLQTQIMQGYRSFLRALCSLGGCGLNGCSPTWQRDQLTRNVTDIKPLAASPSRDTVSRDVGSLNNVTSIQAASSSLGQRARPLCQSVSVQINRGPVLQSLCSTSSPVPSNRPLPQGHHVSVCWSGRAG